MNIPMRLKEPTKLRFTIEQYHEMSEQGILDPLVRTELLRGEVIVMPSKATPHEVCLSRLIKAMCSLVGDRAMVRVQSPILLPPDSEPEPDISILCLREDDYLKSHPLPNEVLLAIEVSDSSLHIDRGLKLGIYAESDIQNYWIFDVKAQRLETYSKPFRIETLEIGNSYRIQEIFTKNDFVELPGLDGVRLNLSQIFK